MADKEQFLAMIRRSLGVSERQEIEPSDATSYFMDTADVADEASSIQVDARARRDDVLAEFIERATAAGWNIHGVSSPEDAADEIAEVIRNHGATTVMRSDHEILNSLPLESALSADGVSLTIAQRDPAADWETDLERRLALRERTFTAQVGITGLDFAIAETGTIAIEPRQGASRLVSLTPEVHIAVMTPDSIIPSLDELFTLTRNQFHSGEHRGMINLITGPSRTADIEANIVIGVHGPREVHIVLIG